MAPRRAQRRVAQLFGVQGYPTSVVLDHEGIVRATKSGWGAGADSWLSGEIRQYVKRATEAGSVPPLLHRP